MRVKYYQRRRLTGRMSLLVSTLGLLVFFGSAQAASASLTSVTNTNSTGPYTGNAEGCPGEPVEFEGTGFGGLGTHPNAKWKVPTTFAFPFEETTTEVTVTDATGEHAKGAIPLTFMVVNGPFGPVNGLGKVKFKGEKPFTYINLYTCFELGPDPTSGAIEKEGGSGSIVNERQTVFTGLDSQSHTEEIVQKIMGVTQTFKKFYCHGPEPPPGVPGAEDVFTVRVNGVSQAGTCKMPPGVETVNITIKAGELFDVQVQLVGGNQFGAVTWALAP